MKQKIICIFSLLFPPSLIQLWYGDDNLLARFLYIFIASLISFIVIFIIGLVKKNKFLIISLPIFIFSTIFYVGLINFQSKKNQRNANHIIAKLESYKNKTSKYPEKLTDLTPNFIAVVPKEWYGISARDFRYELRKDYKSFSLTLFLGEKAAKIWESGMDQWQFLD